MVSISPSLPFVDGELAVALWDVSTVLLEPDVNHLLRGGCVGELRGELKVVRTSGRYGDLGGLAKAVVDDADPVRLCCGVQLERVARVHEGCGLVGGVVERTIVTKCSPGSDRAKGSL
jgi:hypothetical protein